MSCIDTFAAALGKSVNEISTAQYDDVKKMVEAAVDLLEGHGISPKAAIEDILSGRVNQGTQALSRFVENVVQQESKALARESIAAFQTARAMVERKERALMVATKDKRSVSFAIKKTEAVQDMINTPYNAGLSLENLQKQRDAYYRGARYFGRLQDELGPEYAKMMTDPQFQRDMVHELFNLTHQAPSGTPNVKAQQAAKIIFDVLGEQRTQQAVQGMYVARKDVMPMRFDWATIQKAGKEAFVADISNGLNLKTHGDIRNAANIASDVFDSLERNKGIIDWRELGDRNTKDGKVANEYDAKPILDFKDADTWLALNDKYGREDVLNAIESTIKHNAEQEAAARIFGANPDRNFEELLTWAQQDETGKLDRSAMHAAKKARAYYQQATTVSVPPNMLWARTNTIGRTANTASDLGGAVIAGFVDVPVQTYAAKAFVGIPAVKAVQRHISGAFSKADREIAAKMGTYAEGTLNNLSSRIGAGTEPFDKLSEGMSKIADGVLRLSGLNLWTGVHKSGATLSLAENFGDMIRAGRKFDQLEPELRLSLDRFEISKAEWNALSRSNLDARGRLDIFTVDNNAGGGASTQQKLWAWMIDHVETMVLTPGRSDKYYSTFGIDPNSNLGQAIASMTQFMSFPIAFGRKIVARTLWGNEDSTMQTVQNMATLMIVTTAMGGIVVQTRELLQGRKPYKWEDPDFILKAVMAGGGAGIASDMVMKFGLEEAMRIAMGGDEPSTGNILSLAGPFYSDVLKIMNGTIKAGGHAIHGNEDKSLHEVSKVTDTILKSVPGRSIWWLAAAYRAAVMDNAHYALDPQSYRESQRRVWRDTKGRAEGWFDQDRPSQNVGWVGDVVAGVRAN